MWKTLRTFINRTGLTYNELKTAVLFAEDLNNITNNLDYLKINSDIVDTLSGGNANQVLTKDTNTNFDFSWKDSTGGGGGGQLLYDILVAPVGGDFTLLSSALASATAGQTIFVKNGTYAEANPIDFYDYALNLTIIGESAMKTIIELNSTLYGPTGMFLNSKNPTFKNLTFTSGVSNQHLINVNCENSVGIGFHFENCIFETTSTSCYDWFTSLNVKRETHSMITNCLFIGAPTNGTYAISLGGAGIQFTNNHIHFTSNHSQYDMQVSGEYCLISGNKIVSKANSGIYFGGASCIFSNNLYYSYHDGYTKYMINMTSNSQMVTNNLFVCRADGPSLGYAIITVGGNGNIFSGNRVGKYENGTQTANSIINLSGTDCGVLGNVIGKVSSGNHVVITGTGCLDNGNLKIT